MASCTLTESKKKCGTQLDQLSNNIGGKTDNQIGKMVSQDYTVD